MSLGWTRSRFKSKHKEIKTYLRSFYNGNKAAFLDATREHSFLAGYLHGLYGSDVLSDEEFEEFSKMYIEDFPHFTYCVREGRLIVSYCKDGNVVEMVL